MRGAIRGFAFFAALTVAPAAGWAEDGGLLPSWLSVPWSGGTLPAQTAPGSQGPQQPAKESDKIIKLPATAAELDCPEVDIFDGGATARVGGADSASVRYQFDITDVARECLPQGAQFALKIGVAGRLLIGPAGSPGAYSSTLRIVVKREGVAKPVYEKAFPVAANTSGGAQAPFRIITDPVMLPLTRARLDDDYSITVGLGGAAGRAPAAHHRRARHKG